MRSQEQYIQAVKSKYNFWHEMLFEFVPGDFSDLIHRYYLIESMKTHVILVRSEISREIPLLKLKLPIPKRELST